jgi:hypothetical protein
MMSDPPRVEDSGSPAPAEEPAAQARPEEVETLARRILGGLGFEVTVTARDAGATIEVDVAGPDRDFLLDHKAEALNALQYLLNRIIYRGRTGKKIHLDSEGYRRLSQEDRLAEHRKSPAPSRLFQELVLHLDAEELVLRVALDLEPRELGVAFYVERELPVLRLVRQ